MAKKKLNLIINNADAFDNNQGYHTDNFNSKLSKEHTGTYLIVASKNKSTRTYLDYDNKVAFYGKKIKSSKLEILTLFKEYESFIKTVVFKIIEYNSDYTMSKITLKGMLLFLEWSKQNKIPLTTEYSIFNDYQISCYKYTSKYNSSSSDRAIRTFFTKISEINDKFQVLSNRYKKKSVPKLALSSSVVYQLDYYSSLEIDEIVANCDAKEPPNVFSIYPFILQLLIREGLNQETLFDFRVKKYDDRWVLNCKDSTHAIIIDSTKNRSNSIVTTTIDKNSKQYTYINFLIKWLSPLYEVQKSNRLFQHWSNGDIRIWGEKNYFANLKASNADLFSKYEIIDEDGIRLSYIDHTRIRPYSNYANYLRGYNNFKRQLLLSHNNIKTQEHYENNCEWGNIKKDKILKTQEKLTKLFSGILTREDTLNDLFNGPLADCKEPNAPTYIGSRKLRENEYCSDWSKCLTSCDKACVIPKIHGGVIVAWKRYLEAIKEDFLRIEDWEKEYYYDYTACQEVLRSFTNEELIEAERKSNKYDSFVRYKFTKKTKVLNNVA